MKFLNRLLVIAFVASFALVMGCSKEDEKVLESQEKDDTSKNDDPQYDESYIKYSDYVIVDFDKEYGECSGEEFVDNLSKAISKADPYYKTMILLNSPQYDLDGRSLTISNHVLLSGAIPDDVDNSKVGAQGVTTKFVNMQKMYIRSSNVTLANIKLVDRSASIYGFIVIIERGVDMPATGISFYNTIVEGASAQILGRSGAGVTCQNCTFDKFTGAGYLSNRSLALDTMPKCEFRYCDFYCNEKIANYDTRGISFDAGNTEYPVVWDLQGTTISNCFFNHNGVGFSKCCNAKVLNSEFTGNTLYRDMFHAEEFSHNLLVEGNTFIHDTPSRGFYIDRERQNATDIRIVNNKFKGEIGWVISSYSPQGLVFEGNDFTEATFSTSNMYKHFDFTYYSGAGDSEFVPYEVATKGLSMKNNKGLSGYTMRIYEEEGDNSNVFTESGDVTSVTVPAIAPILEDGNYKMKSKTGKYLSLNGSGNVVLTSDEAKAVAWQLAFDKFQNYTLKSVDTGCYLEVYDVYTLGNMRDQSFSTVFYATNKNTYVGKGCAPFFYFEQRDKSVDEYVVYPGGNECKSRLTAKYNDKLAIEMTKSYATGAYVAFSVDDECTWILESVTGQTQEK